MRSVAVASDADDEAVTALTPPHRSTVRGAATSESTSMTRRPLRPGSSAVRRPEVLSADEPKSTSRRRCPSVTTASEAGELDEVLRPARDLRERSRGGQPDRAGPGDRVDLDGRSLHECPVVDGDRVRLPVGTRGGPEGRHALEPRGL